MQKIHPLIKRTIFFLILVTIVPWFNMAVFFALYSYFADKEMQIFIKENAQILYDNGYITALWAFILTYIIAIHFINKKISYKIWRFILYILTDISCFILLCFLP